MREVVIGTRGSMLALWQAEHIKSRLENELKIPARLEVVKTRGDKILDVPLAKIGGKGLFTKELEELLLQKKIDLAVHSLKDVPVEFVDGLGLACITTREDVRDCFLSVKYENLDSLPLGARVGTTSLRRCMQIKAKRSDLDTQSLRGNVQTRLKRLFDGEFDAIILAKAGLNRLKITHSDVPFIRAFELEEILPAMGQGALGIEMRLDDDLLSLICALNDENTALCTQAERQFIKTLNGGCQVPIGVHASLLEDTIKIEAILGLPNGEKIMKDLVVGKKDFALNLAENLAQNFIQKGALEILEEAQKMVFS
ncbi:hydroxymethylbilane synthase [Helicobacter sp. faydin-H20]|uniref:hydroxymethylbilane synthase n=1 Tax=Helicobacter anatolicus TaxID=2905874 RepID=UPI001E5F80CD|nr:hydroxymethylbilane synthase [Helicobacter anatolicus]MCE3037292.1 hydroxymethylbilane synthase [Helicobacter anatolicus]